MKSLGELLNSYNSYEDILTFSRRAKNKYEILDNDKERSGDILQKMQLPVSDYLGAIIYNTGGIIIDNGRIRLVGGGSDRMKRDILEWNYNKSFSDYNNPRYGFLLVADDALGGLFAINYGDFGDDIGKMYYLALDYAEWVSLDITFKEFIIFCFSDDLSLFHSESDIVWNNQDEYLALIPYDSCMSFEPPVWDSESVSIPLNDRVNSIIDMNDMYYILLEYMNDVDSMLTSDSFYDDDDDEELLISPLLFEEYDGDGGSHDHDCNCHDHEDKN